MSRQAHPAAYAANLPRKLDGAVPPDLRVLDPETDFQGSTASSPDINIEASAADLELGQVRAEVAELRNRLEQADQVLNAAVASEEGWLEKQREFELLLEEKSDVIRTLHQKIQELQEGSAGDNLARAEELEHTRADLEERRKQLDQDEESLMAQMRNMEMAMSRDRADLARQRNELLRLQADLNREIEMASRDPALHERLSSLRRRHQEVASKTVPLAPTKSDIQIPPPVPQPEPAPSIKKSGLLRRIFGNSEK